MTQAPMPEATVAEGQAPGAGIDFFAAAFSPEFRDDPYPFFHTLREAEPVHQTELGVYVLSTHADAAAVIRDPRLSSDERNSDLYRAFVEARGDLDAEWQDRLSRVILFLDPPDHTRLRSLVSQAFTPRTVDRLRLRVHELVDGLLEAVEARGDGRMDVIGELAYPLPVIVICELLGVPAAEHTTFQEWSRVLAGSIDPEPLRMPEQEVEIAEAALAFSDYFADLIDRRRREPGDDLLSALIAAEEGGDRLTEEELLTTGMFLLIAGHETTVNLIGNGTLALLRHPGELAGLRDDPSLDRSAVEELLRYDSPVQLTQRITIDDFQVGGMTIPKGQNLVPLLGAANRDPEAFADPDRLDLARSPNRHVAFGGGHHFCLGAALARLEGEVAVTSLVRRFRTLEPDGEPVRRATFTLRGLQQLPVRVAP